MSKTIVITGASRGLGKALSNEFRDAGWHVIATARKPETIEKADTVTALPLDISDSTSVKAFAHEMPSHGLNVDFLINNAGFNPKDVGGNYFQSTFKIAHFSAENTAQSMMINALMPMELVSKLLPVLSEDAAVLNISSWLGSIGGKEMGGHYGYAGSKSLLNMMTKALALEWKDTHRTAVALNPGWMRTDMGGQNAKITPQEVAVTIRKLYEDGTLHKNNGQFLNTDASIHPW